MSTSTIIIWTSVSTRTTRSQLLARISGKVTRFERMRSLHASTRTFAWFSHLSLSLSGVPDSEEEEPELTVADLACWDEAQRGICEQAAASSQHSGVAKTTSSPSTRPADPAAAAQTEEHHFGFVVPDHQAFLRMPAVEEAGRRLAGEESAKRRDYDTVFTNAKAGMDDVDKDYVKSVVYDMSRESNFFKNEQRKSELSSQRNLALKEKLDALTGPELDAAEKWAAKHMAFLEKTRDLSRTFIHVDMDMFFAAVEQMYRAELEHVPFAIGGLGMISTANYVARKYGVRRWQFPQSASYFTCCLNGRER